MLITVEFLSGTRFTLVLGRTANRRVNVSVFSTSSSLKIITFTSLVTSAGPKVTLVLTRLESLLVALLLPLPDSKRISTVIGTALVPNFSIRIPYDEVVLLSVKV